MKKDYRRVLVELKLYVPMQYPKDHTEHDINFNLNESSRCAGNSITDILKMERLLDMRRSCFCWNMEGRYITELPDKCTLEDIRKAIPEIVNIKSKKLNC